MPSDIPVGTGQATFVFQNLIAPKNVVCTMGLDLSDAGGDYVACANAAFTAWQTTFLPHQSNNATLVHVDLFIGNDSGSSGSVRSTLPAQDGGETADCEGPAISALVNKNTSFLGRAGRGRMFVPYILPDNTTTTGGAIVGSRLTIINSAGTDFLDQLAAGGVDIPVIPAVLLGHTTAGTIKTATPILSLTAVSTVGVRPTRQR